MAESFKKQFDYIKADIGKISSGFAKQLAERACEDLSEAHEKIVGKYYDSYDPNTYNRSYGLYNSLIKHHAYKKGTQTYEGGISSSSFQMDNHYAKGYYADTVFDLVWNSGIRGLPRKGDNPLSHSFDWNGKHWNTGDIWENPYWNYSKYKNIFRTSIVLNGYKSKIGTPHLVMKDITVNWDKAGGLKACDDIANKIMNKT